MYNLYNIHLRLLHAAVSDVLSGQVPSEHDLVLVFVPSPHVTLHDQLPHDDIP